MPAQVSSREALRLLPDEYRLGVAEAVPEDKMAALQARTEGVDIEKNKDGSIVRKVTLMDKEFRIGNKVGLMPLMEFAYFADSGADTNDMGALVAIYEMLKDCIHEEDWDAFRAHAKQMKAEAEDLLPVVQQTIEQLTSRPTARGTDSSVGSSRTSDTLTDTSSGQKAQLQTVDDLVSSL
jgi:hypothetical protein